MGVRSIEHRNVLGEKINFSVHSARKIVIFGRDDLDPLNINANLFWTPPICLKMTKCAIFSTFWESHFKNTPKVGVHRENFNIGNLSQIFFGDFYTCYEYAISFSTKFLIKNFSRWASTSPSPESHLLFEKLLKIGKYQFWGRKFFKIFFFQKRHES